MLTFLLTMFGRFIAFVSGRLNFSDLASDEVQIIVLAGIAISSALIGTFLVLRGMTMLANSLSHTILLGIVIAFVISHFGMDLTQGYADVNVQIMLLGALLASILTAFLTQFLNKVARLQEDASIGLVFTSLFALGIVLVTLLTRNAHIGAEAVMGNVDALHIHDIWLVMIVLAINAISVLFFFKEFQITTFDPALAKALGISTLFFDYLLMLQTSVTSIGAFRAVGVLMVLAFITGPALMARFLTNRLKPMLWIACALGCVASIFGVALSRHFLSVHNLALSTGGIVVCTIFVMFLATLALSRQWICRLGSRSSTLK